MREERGGRRDEGGEMRERVEMREERRERREEGGER